MGERETERQKDRETERQRDRERVLAYTFKVMKANLDLS